MASRAALALSGLALALLLAEGAARALGGGGSDPVGGDRRLWTYDRTKGWFHAPGARGASFLGGPDRGTIRINSLGLRGGELAMAKAPSRRRLLVLGDSFVFGVGVDEDHLFTTHLGRLLGPGYEVVNMGVSGYSTDQEFLLLGELGGQLSPDLVLLVACDNDFDGNLLDLVYLRYYKPFFVRDAEGRLQARNVPVPVLRRSQRLKAWLAEHSSLWGALRRRRAESPPARTVLGWLEVGKPRRSPEDAVEVTAALVLAMRERAESMGARFLMVNSGHRGERTALFHALRPRLEAQGVAFHGLEGHQAEARKRDPQRRWEFPHDTHWNVDAHQAAAEVLHLHLKRTGALD